MSLQILITFCTFPPNHISYKLYLLFLLHHLLINGKNILTAADISSIQRPDLERLVRTWQDVGDLWRTFNLCSVALTQELAGAGELQQGLNVKTDSLYEIISLICWRVRQLPNYVNQGFVPRMKGFKGSKQNISSVNRWREGPCT